MSLIRMVRSVFDPESWQSYFVADSARGEVHSRARIDASAIVGGALACAFFVAALTSVIPSLGLSEAAITASAAVAGGAAGKAFLV